MGKAVQLKAKDWKVPQQTFKSKAFDAFSYVWVLGGMALLSLFFIGHDPTFLLGAVMTLGVYMYRQMKYRVRLVEEEGKKSPIIKAWVSVICSMIGVALIWGSIIGFSENTAVFYALTLLAGVIISVFSRYTFENINILSIFEDFILYQFVFGGIILSTYSLTKVDSSPILAIILTGIGILWSAFFLITREKLVFLRKPINPKKKFFITVTAITGVVLIAGSVGGLLTGNSLFMTSLLLLEGVMCIAGATIYNDRRTLTSIKDIL